MATFIKENVDFLKFCHYDPFASREFSEKAQGSSQREALGQTTTVCQTLVDCLTLNLKN